jgi:predicted amidohydrolase YtcJ
MKNQETGSSTSSRVEAADYVVQNGKIYTSNQKQPWAEAIAIKGENIVYVGDDKGAQPFKGKNTIVADLRGKFMMPGIVTTHEHPLMVMGLFSGLMLEFTGDADKMLASLKEYVEKKPDAPAFSFGGSWEGRVEIYRQDIDKIVSDKPFLMIAASGHGGWCNSKALEVTGVTKDTPDPIDSFQREADGTPNGYLESSASVMWMTGQLGVIQQDAVQGQAKSILDQFARYGITAVYDAGAPYSEDAVYPVIAELEKSGDLTMRISASPITQRPVMTEGAMAAMKKYKALHSSEFFKVDTFKIHGDGDTSGWTAGMLEPYADNPESTGLTSFPADNQREITLAAAEMGYDVHTHAIGDRTVRQTLDAYQAVREAGYDKVRLTTAHTSLVHPDDKPRFKELDVIVNTFAAENAVFEEAGVTRLGSERYLENCQPMGSFVDMGVRVVMSADYPTASLNPFLQMSIAMTRSNPGEEKSLPPESERLTLEQAIRAYTIDAAYMLRWEDIIGSLEVGKRADLIVLDRNPFELTPDEIAEVNVLATMMNGVVVHEEAINWSPPKELSGVALVP